MIKSVVRLVVLLSTTTIALSAFASQVFLIPLEEDVKQIKNVLRVKVEGIERQEQHLRLANGKEGRLLSSRLIVTGKVRAVVWGKCALRRIKTSYTEFAGIKYDENVPEGILVSLSRSGSGLETKVKKGQEYLFSFSGIYPDRTVQDHLRMDEVAAEGHIVELLTDAALIGRTKDEVLAQFGQPSSQEGEAWSYLAPPVPGAPSFRRVRELLFQAGKVTKVSWKEIPIGRQERR
jgi:hypothetical protein